MYLFGCRVSLSRAVPLQTQRTDGGCSVLLAGREENRSEAFLQRFFILKQAIPGDFCRIFFEYAWIPVARTVL
jgi:hypothetical protein